MGWRAQDAYDREAEAEWRRRQAAEPLWPRVLGLIPPLLIMAAIATLLAGPFLAGMLGG